MTTRLEISDECVRCGFCAEACPRGAVKEDGETFVIESAECDLCGTDPRGGACALACPVEAVYARRVEG